MTYEINPENFSPSFEVAGCIIDSGEEIILLKRKNSSIQGNKWGIPSGKMEKNEKILETAKREIFEETGIILNKIEQKRKYNVRHDGKLDFIYHLFYSKIKKQQIKLNTNEHMEAKWISPKKALELELVDGTEECIKEIYRA